MKRPCHTLAQCVFLPLRRFCTKAKPGTFPSLTPPSPNRDPTFAGTPQKTALYQLHKDLGGRMTVFNHYSLPAVYEEHGAVASCLHTRTQASLFDASHKAQLRIFGKDRHTVLEALTVTDIKGMENTDTKLTLFTNDQGGIIDDCFISTHENFLHLHVNAETAVLSRLENYIQTSGLNTSVELLKDHSLLSLQGPLASTVLQPCVSIDLSKLLFMHAVPDVQVDGIPNCMITRCGFTGEDGFEIAVPNQYAESLAKCFLSHEAVKPAGLGARNALRLEAGFCEREGGDYTAETTPVEANLAWTVGKRRRQEGGFPGAPKILEQLQSGVSKKRVGLKLTDESHFPPDKAHLFLQESETSSDGPKQPSNSATDVGHLTTLAFSPSLQLPIAMGYVRSASSKAGTRLQVETGHGYTEAVVTTMPFCPTSYYTTVV